MNTRTETKTAIGMMSGTSMDGIDACLLKINGDFSFDVLDTYSMDYPTAVVEKLMAAANNNSSVADICNLNFVVAKLFAQCANGLISKNNYKPDFIASHGQTVFHIPSEVETGSIKTKSTLQIGDISVIAEDTGICTVGNFRTRDIAAGGFGAPLVPFADELIFKKDVSRAIQNIGGIGNVTVLSRECETFAFDTGPGNMLMDWFVKKLFGVSFDKGGDIAAKGVVDETWLNELLKEPYYSKLPPKTTGRELFNDIYAEKFSQTAPESPYDVIATITALSAKTIANAYKDFVFARTGIKEAVIGGGGAYNKTLLKFLEEYLPDIEIKTHADFGISDKYKEAIAFALLGYCTLNGIPNNLPACTGAKKAVVMGEIAK